jgi:hypothetical protein
MKHLDHLIRQFYKRDLISASFILYELQAEGACLVGFNFLGEKLPWLAPLPPELACASCLEVRYGRVPESNRRIDELLAGHCAGQRCLICADLSPRGLVSLLRAQPIISQVAASCHLVGVHDGWIRSAEHWLDDPLYPLECSRVPLRLQDRKFLRSLLRHNPSLAELLGPQSVEVLHSGHELQAVAFFAREQFRNWLSAGGRLGTIAFPPAAGP